MSCVYFVHLALDLCASAGFSYFYWSNLTSVSPAAAVMQHGVLWSAHMYQPTSQNESLSDYIHNRMNINLPSTYTVLHTRSYILQCKWLISTDERTRQSHMRIHNATMFNANLWLILSPAQNAIHQIVIETCVCGSPNVMLHISSAAGASSNE